LQDRHFTLQSLARNDLNATNAAQTAEKRVVPTRESCGPLSARNLVDYLDLVVVEFEPLIPPVFEPLVCPGA
jgi:hypothetical protein